MVTIKEDGVERRVTAAEAFLLYMTKRGLEGDGTAARSAMVAIEDARMARKGNGEAIRTIVVRMVAPGSVNTALRPLRMASKLDPSAERQDHARALASGEGSFPARWRAPVNP